MKLGSEILYLSRDNIGALNIGMSNVISLLEESFLEKAKGNVEALPKIELHPKQDDNFINAMLCSFPKFKAAGLKWISAYPGNREKGLPYISGLIVLNDQETGFPMAIMEAGILTAIRTGAVTGLSAKYLARKNSHTVAILGCGVQARTQLQAVLSICPEINTVKAYDINNEATTSFAQEMELNFKVIVEHALNPLKAVEDSDIIITAGPILASPQPVIERSWLKEGCFGAPIDYDSYWRKSSFEAAARIYVDDVPQFESHREMGYFSTVPTVYGDLADLVSGKIPGRLNDSERIIAINLGLSLEDIAVAALVYDHAKKHGVGQILSI
ncbi:MAG: Ornithine cyclodeaminase [Firmicutes bacterium]|nr:Ornithine cyclodeaminase [Bacillota bacterium]